MAYASAAWPEITLCVWIVAPDFLAGLCIEREDYARLRAAVESSVDVQRCRHKRSRIFGNIPCSEVPRQLQGRDVLRGDRAERSKAGARGRASPMRPVVASKRDDSLAGHG